MARHPDHKLLSVDERKELLEAREIEGLSRGKLCKRFSISRRDLMFNLWCAGQDRKRRSLRDAQEGMAT